MSLTIRSATVSDCPTIVGLIRALGDYEKLLHEVVVTPEQIQRTLFGDLPEAGAIVAEWNGEIVGFALFCSNYSTFLGRAGVHLEDLFVHEPFRGKGIGKRLLREVARITLEKGAQRLQWSVLDWNQTAIEFYEKCGAVVMPDWRNCRVTGAALTKLASEPDGHKYEPPFPILTTDRLRLEPVSLAHADAIQRIVGDYEVSQNLLNVPYPYPPDGARDYILTQPKMFAKGIRNWAIVIQESNEVAGMMGLVVKALHRKAELGYWFGQTFWGKGIATEAGKAVVEYGFEKEGLYRIEANVFARNPASARVLEKIGLNREGTLHGCYFKEGIQLDGHLYGLTRPQWLSDQ